MSRRSNELDRVRSLSLVWAEQGRVADLRWAERMHQLETTTAYGRELGVEVEAALAKVNGALADLVEACDRHDAAQTKGPG